MIAATQDAILDADKYQQIDFCLSSSMLNEISIRSEAMHLSEDTDGSEGDQSGAFILQALYLIKQWALENQLWQYLIVRASRS